jgi:ubiquinol-cytochrome c reductase cytochrome b/c1 subunit
MSNPGVTTQVMQWVETRLPIFSFINHSVGTEYPAPRNLNYWWSLGSIAGVALVLQIVTGIVLAMHYVPHADMAFESVEHIMRDVNYGWMLRYMHANGASLFFVAVYIHMFRGLYFGSYKAPRELLWWFGILIFLAMMATAFMGYVLPWGQMSFWGATVITNMFTAIPVVGEAITTWLWGGYSVAGPTLQRFFSLHYLLPFVIFALMFLHLWALHTSKSNNPLGIEVKTEKDTLPFHPYYTTKDLVGFGVFFIILAYWVFFNPNYMGHPDNYVPANPLVTPPHIVPEWYFLPFYAILRAVPDKLGGVVLMLGAILILFVIPWLDTSRVRSATFRPVYKGFFWIFVLNGLVLGWIGANPPEGAYIIIGRIATIYYFAHFILVMPIVGWLEKPKPLPDSIAAAVLGDDSAKEAK